MDAGRVVTQREQLDSAHRLRRDRRKRLRGDHFERQFHGVAVDARLAAEQASERHPVAEANGTGIQLLLGKDTHVHEA